MDLGSSAELPADEPSALPVPVRTTGSGRRHTIPRRQVLGWMSGGLAAGVAVPKLRLLDLLSGTNQGRRAFWTSVVDSLTDLGTPKLSYRAAVTRRDDMCNLGFQFFNLRLDPASTELVPVNPTMVSYMAVVFPPQHVGEEAVDFTTTPPWPSPPL
jgi:hypothetical protein